MLFHVNYDAQKEKLHKGVYTKMWEKGVYDVR